ncbi:hypothetical protein [Bacillus sp. NEB1478]|uniref:hypothetical protein n=1 Tax=Bacillus sp. NEB1478 TaxID=3073816 RepID=UPI002873F285|nr:hypothetical protein [Bacillus sp. NEB1478]WNB92684.1 hypothetical protein RGB74_03155 [Bacillus sp. NEB1478]
MKYIKVGKLNVELAISSKLGDEYFNEEFSYFSKGDKNNIDASYLITDAKEPANHNNKEMLGSNFTYDKKILSISTSGLIARKRKVSIEKEKNKTTFYFTRPYKLLNELYRLYSRDYLSFNETAIKDFVYNVFEPTLQQVQVKKGQSFVHGALLVNDKNEGLLVTGWGGSGKSSLGTQLLKNGWSMGSDDLLVVNEDGKAFSYPKRAQVYAYNLVGNKQLKDRIFGTLPLSRKIVWKIRESLLGPTKVRRRVPLSFIGNSVENNNPITIKRVLDVRRSTDDIASVQKISSEDFALTHSQILLYEFQPFTSQMLALDTFVPNEDSVFSTREKTKEVLKKAVESADIRRILVPKNCNPNDLLKVYLDNIDG